MKTFLSDLFPKLQRFSQKLDNLTLLTNQHWVLIDNISLNKTIYIFRSNNDLLISTNGKVEKAKWEYIGNKSLLIDRKTESYLFKHGFFDRNILALKVDNSKEYAIFVNEDKYDAQLNSAEKVFKFLRSMVDLKTGQPIRPQIANPTDGFFKTYRGVIHVKLSFAGAVPAVNNSVYQNGEMAKDGKYRLGFMDYITVRNGIITDLSIF